MGNTTKLLPTLFLLLLATACTTQPLYSPAARPDGSGYWETRLTENRYRVTFTGRNATASETVKDYALLRAAELTIDNGFDWFQVVERENDGRVIDHSEPRVSVGVGIGGGRGCGGFGCGVIGSRWYTGVLVNPVSYAGHYQTSLEILMGKGEPEDPNKVYDARELAKNLRESLKVLPD